MSTSSNFASSNQPIVKVGNGLLVLTGTADQVSFGTPQDIHLVGGTLVAELGVNFGTNNILHFRGGVLEIANGGAFTRALGTGAGQAAFDESGGFSARTANAIVNIGGAATPSTLTWGSTADFLQDGQALLFGSGTANAILDFQNPINLGGSSSTYTARMISVVRGAGGDLARLSGVISGPSGTDLLKAESGTLELTAANTYTGNTLVARGTLLLASGGSLASRNYFINSGTFTPDGTIPTDSNVTIVGDALVSFNNSKTIGTLAGAGRVQINGAGTVLTVGNDVSTTYSGMLQSSGGLTKQGSGALILSSFNSYTGPTTINAGTLSVTGFLVKDSTVTVNNGGTLAGTGTVPGPTTVQSGGKVSPGNSNGISTGVSGRLTFSSAGLTVNSGGTYVWDLTNLRDNSTGTAGTDFDQIQVSGGNLQLNTGSQLTLNFLPTTHPDAVVPFWQSSHQWTIVSLTGGTNSGATNFSTITNGNTYADAGTFTVSLSGGSVVLNFMPIPEPSGLLVVGTLVVGGAGWLWRRVGTTPLPARLISHPASSTTTAVDW